MTFTDDEITALVTGLDEPCWSCFGGEGRFAMKRDENDQCTICNGSGYTLTESGRALLEWLRRHYNKGERR